MSSYLSPQFKYIYIHIPVDDEKYKFCILYSSSSMDILHVRSHDVTSSVGRALYRYPRGHGFESHSGLNSDFNYTTA